MKYIRFIIIGLASALLIYVFFGVYQNRIKKESQNAPIRPINEENSNKQQWETKTDDRPPVAIEITPVELSKNAEKWKFNITLNTHSVELSQDLMQIATLVDDKGNIYKLASWEGAPPGGHHREAVLVFDSISQSPKFVEVRIKDIDEASDRIFKWDIK